MSIAVRPGTTVEAVHMHLVYVGSVEHDDGPRENGSVLPGELTRVFHQLELLISYALRITAVEHIPASPPNLMDAPSLLAADKRLSPVRKRDGRVGGAAVGCCWGALARADRSVSGGPDGQGVEVVGEDRPSGPGLLAFIAFESAAAQAVAAFEVADASFGAGAVAAATVVGCVGSRVAGAR